MESRRSPMPDTRSGSERSRTRSKSKSRSKKSKSKSKKKDSEPGTKTKRSSSKREQNKKSSRRLSFRNRSGSRTKSFSAIPGSRSQMPRKASLVNSISGPSHKHSKSWSKIKGWVGLPQDDDDDEDMMIETDNPLAEPDKNEVHHLSKRKGGKTKPKTYSSKLDAERFELNVPRHQRSKSALTNKVTMERLKLEEEHEKAMRKMKMHRKKSSKALRKTSTMEALRPDVSNAAFLPNGPRKGSGHISKLALALQNAESKVRIDQDNSIFGEMDSDFEDDIENDPDARAYYLKKSLSATPRDLEAYALGAEE